MQKKDLNNISHKLENKIINVAYGDAGYIDWLIVHWKSIMNHEIKNLLNEYRVTAKAVHQVYPEEASQNLTESIRKRTIGEKKPRVIIRFISDLLFVFFSKKVILAAMFGFILIAAVYFYFQTPDRTSKYSQTEIRLAQKQFKQTMGIIGDAFEKAEKGFNEEVLNNQINKNLNRGYFLVNNILIGG